MGSSISQATYEKIQKLNAEGRRCKMGSCTQRATYVLTMTCQDVKADGTVSQPMNRNANDSFEQGFCGKHAKEQLRCFEVHGKPVEGLPGARRYEVAAGNSKQVVTLLSSRKLARDEKLGG